MGKEEGVRPLAAAVLQNGNVLREGSDPLCNLNLHGISAVDGDGGAGDEVRRV